MRMSGALKKIEAEALKLPTRSRAKLVERLLESFESEPDAEAEAAWIVEAQRRYEEIRTGVARTESATEVFKRLRAAIR
jgi:putative addiction module component (TIGR02574 family)